MSQAKSSEHDLANSLPPFFLSPIRFVSVSAKGVANDHSCAPPTIVPILEAHSRSKMVQFTKSFRIFSASSLD